MAPNLPIISASGRRQISLLLKRRVREERAHKVLLDDAQNLMNDLLKKPGWFARLSPELRPIYGNVRDSAVLIDWLAEYQHAAILNTPARRSFEFRAR